MFRPCNTFVYSHKDLFSLELGNQECLDLSMNGDISLIGSGEISRDSNNESRSTRLHFKR